MEKEKIMQTINDLQSQYENVHVHMDSKFCTFDIWGSTNHTNNTINEWTKNIVYTDDGVLCIKNVLHGVVMDERDSICLDNIIASSVKVEPSVYWEDGQIMYIQHEDGNKTYLDFFN